MKENEMDQKRAEVEIRKLRERLERQYATIVKMEDFLADVTGRIHRLEEEYCKAKELIDRRDQVNQ